MRKRGFTLIELLVVIVIIGILVAIALPNFIKIKDKAKEAEVKQNLHSVQLAVERYATDKDGGYPYFLWGGTAEMNIGVMNFFSGDGNNRPGAFMWGDDVSHPFDMFWINTPTTWDYHDTGWGDIVAGNTDSPFGDTLAYEGYMPKYPGNPFQQQNRARTFGLDGLNVTSSSAGFGEWACYGGRDGTSMWNVAYWGQLPQTIEFFVEADSVQGDFPGNFSYHPRWSDGRTNEDHLQYQQNYQSDSWLPQDIVPAAGPNLAQPELINSLDVAGYDLTASGAKRTKGQDLDNSVLTFSTHFHRTGYLTLGQERNPWVEAGDFPGVNDYDERPLSDSVPDFIIIHLSSGIDQKVTNPINPAN